MISSRIMSNLALIAYPILILLYLVALRILENEEKEPGQTKENKRSPHHPHPSAKEFSFLPVNILAVNKREISHTQNTPACLQKAIKAKATISKKSFSPHFFLAETVVKLDILEVSLGGRH